MILELFNILLSSIIYKSFVCENHYQSFRWVNYYNCEQSLGLEIYEISIYLTRGVPGVVTNKIIGQMSQSTIVLVLLHGSNVPSSLNLVGIKRYGTT